MLDVVNSFEEYNPECGVDQLEGERFGSECQVNKNEVGQVQDVPENESVAQGQGRLV